MRELALFAGAGGGLLASRLLGFETMAAVEIDEFCQEILRARQKDGSLDSFPIFDDVRNFDGTEWRGKVDIVTGGFPCQDISTAGRGAGINGEKSSLWWDMWRVCCEVGASFIFVDNSPEITRRGLGDLLGALASRGWDAEWIVLGAAHVGAPHVRERFWLLASDPNGSTRPELQPQKPVSHQIRNPQGAQLNTLQQSGRFIGPTWGQSPTSICGVDDELADRMDRLKAIGNGWVPQCAAAAFSILWNRLADG